MGRRARVSMLLGARLKRSSLYHSVQRLPPDLTWEQPLKSLPSLDFRLRRNTEQRITIC